MKQVMYVLISIVFMLGGPVSKAAGGMTVQDALMTSNGEDVTVEGYIVGVPTSVDYVEQSNFTSNYALAIADDPDETQISDMIFLKLDSTYRSDFGLQHNPEQMGEKVKVTGTRDDYFSHEGIEYVTSMETVDASHSSGGNSAVETNVQSTMTEPNGMDVTVTGYVVGVPISVDTVQQESFTSDYALALADDPNETEISKMIFIKLDSAYRGEFGLQTNPDHLGDLVEVNGTRDAYFSHQGVEYITSITTVTDNSDGGDGGTNPDPGHYYESAQGLTGATLKQELHNIIDDHTELTYDEVWDALRHTDEDPNNTNNVLLLYTGDSISKYENGGFVDEWNREHVWAKSHGDFGTAMGAGTDVHHLRPTNVSVNSTRGNLDFDNGGNAHTDAPDTYYDQDSWEPRDEVKGDVARMIFYMAVRYEGDQGEVDLEIADQVGTSGPELGKLSTLKQWHQNDPVDAFEQRRNELIFTNYQGNRNPFIDHPEYVEKIW